MLTSLLPGLRELRTPLAAGYVWLVDAWIIFGVHLPRHRPADGPLALVWDLGTFVGPTVVLAVTTFVAYLAGSILEIDPTRLWDFGGRPDRVTNVLNRLRSRTRVLAWVRFPALSASAKQDLTTVAREADPDMDAESLDVVYGRTLREVRQLATRLQVANAELHDKYDRLLTEATFRLNIAPPLTILLLAIIWQSHLDIPWKLLGTLVSALSVVVLLRQVIRKVAHSNEVIMQALVIGLVESKVVRRQAENSRQAG